MKGLAFMAQHFALILNKKFEGLHLVDLQTRIAPFCKNCNFQWVPVDSIVEKIHSYPVEQTIPNIPMKIKITNENSIFMSNSFFHFLLDNFLHEGFIFQDHQFPGERIGKG